MKLKILSLKIPLLSSTCKPALICLSFCGKIQSTPQATLAEATPAESMCHGGHMSPLLLHRVSKLLSLLHPMCPCCSTLSRGASPLLFFMPLLTLSSPVASSPASPYHSGTSAVGFPGTDPTTLPLSAPVAGAGRGSWRERGSGALGCYCSQSNVGSDSQVGA